MVPVGVGFTFRNVDFWIDIVEYCVDCDGEIEISEFSISLDYEIRKEYPHKADAGAHLINSMLADSSRLQHKIIDSIICNDGIEWERIRVECYEQYCKDVRDYHDGMADHSYELANNK